MHVVQTLTRISVRAPSSPARNSSCTGPRALAGRLGYSLRRRMRLTGRPARPEKLPVALRIIHLPTAKCRLARHKLGRMSAVARPGPVHWLRPGHNSRSTGRLCHTFCAALTPILNGSFTFVPTLYFQPNPVAMATPKCFIARHGETEWSKSGQHTSRTDLPLTAHGEKCVKHTGLALVGLDRLINPESLLHVFVSPRARAQHTVRLLLGENFDSVADRLTTDERVREWEYGDYEGLLTKDIRALRKSHGLIETSDGEVGRAWEIWKDGCENGESPEEIVERMDSVIADIQEMQRKAMVETPDRTDVLVVAHGHILRSFATRWVKRTLLENPRFVLDAGGVGVLSYEHNSIDEPAIVLGGSFTVPE
ncbi:histidine phosphatase superfamily [Dipodascopsis tothii]|uniref:histidine phosphatase superfamily n=1 Tax=Dipodascopsis tothii TaxID=44089 RepID=UPI0034CFF619